MTQVYFLYVIGCIISLLLYKQNKIAAKVGFSISAIASAYAVFYFLVNLEQTVSINMFESLLYSPKLVLNPLGNFFSFVVSLVSLASSIYAIQYSGEYEKKGSLAVMAGLFNAFILSMLLLIASSDVFWFIIFWECMTVISAYLICFNDSKSSLKAIMIYLGIAHLGAMCITAAFLIMSAQTGSLEFSSYENIQLSPVMASIVFLLAFIGFGSKAGMFPMHVWLPKAHPAAPTNVSALMSGVMIKVALFGIIKFCLWLPVMEWWGLLIIIVGALSALLGVLYALVQHDYKALLAYHSVENIGIILLGLGTGVYGIAANMPTLAAIGFLAGLYHILNHATFKGLLFLGAGSVLYTTHTKEMDNLGGLARKMPLTAFAFLIGSLAITAIPPLNGFVSEWVTYQGMFQGALSEYASSRVVFCIAIVALALTGALAVMCFVKAYSVIFGGTPRDKKIFENAREVPVTMVIGMFVLVAGCIAFGLGANIVVKDIMLVVSSFSGNYEAVNGTVINSPMGSTVSPLLIAAVLVITVLIPVVILKLAKANRTKPRQTDPWACGFKYDSRMQMTASPFTGDLRRLLNWLYRSETKVKDQGYFAPVVYETHAKDIWWNLLYEPVIKLTVNTAKVVSKMQNGNVNMYSLYILIALCLFVGISYLL
ncbi:hydrogenase-4, transmembrane adaptor [Malaciobacter marinus]|uniref:Hydrogenase 4 subunit B n=1 Tax=Malaciobacter marinus TaxID=505249 RepID=A0A347TM55_9BACT|nr:MULTISPECIES: proton-conducting transporter membrane subunit [Malaciobacter]AXX87683.1 hydrogenase-4, transmembrane adaptor [Malaciobacter marinus]PHO15322.1 hydrogenase 4 subunit B [Malaciobacter marinus]RYA24935.1 hydrogenase 4 subunit B [Malaciobacter halophilus]